MRIHRLRVGAFGPFAEMQDIDFDALGDAGLFLIRGRTGAGKSSLLDAMCFALFGRIPRQRAASTGAGVASDHAPGQQPTVELEFSVAGRRLRIHRTAAYDAIGRGGRATVRRSTVLLEERRAGVWIEHATKEQEAGEFIKRTLGLDLAQFVQLILLPQGEFAAFLRAKPDERGALLERLFAIDRYRDVEAWFAERRAAERTRRDESLREVERSRDRIAEVLVTGGFPTGIGDTPVAQLPSATSALIAELIPQAAAAQTDAEAAQDAAALARRDLAAAGARQERRAEAAAARERLAELEADHAGHVARCAELAAGRRAERVEPFAAAAADRSRRRDDAWRSVQDVDLPDPIADRLPHQPGGTAPVDPAALLTATNELTTALQTGSRTLAELAAPRHAHEVATARQAELQAAHDRLVDLRSTRRTAGDELATEQVSIATQLATSEPTAARSLVVRGCHDTLRELLDCAIAVEAHQRDAEHAVRTAVAAHDESTIRRAEVDRLRAARLAGMAAELGAALRDDQPCPVCGSIDHPKPSAAAADAVTAERVTGAEELAISAAAASAAAQAGLSAARARLAEAEQRWSRAREVLPPWPDTEPWLPVARLAAASAVWSARQPLAADQVRPLVETVSQLADACEDARRQVGVLLERQRELAAAQEQLRALLADADSELATVAARRSDVTAVIEETEATTTAILGRHLDCCPCGGDDAAHERATAAASAMTEAVTAFALESRLTREAEEELSRALDRENFAGPAEFAESLRSPEQLARLDERIDAYDAETRAAHAILQLPAIAAACAALPDDLPSLRERAEQAETVAKQARDEAVRLDRTVSRLHVLAAELGAAHTTYLEVEAQLRTVGSLADTINGTGEDNTRRMRLSAYVLAARLEAVTRFANDRLGQMSDGRFTLEHSDARAKRGVRSGLGLLVRDAWTGQARDTATLSGGESFMASLALALGLGDAVLAETGGRPLETLLVDEGFGSLDEDTLERVLQVLDDLRAGDRVVGIVSHVPDLRQRIPVQVAVHRGEAGSTIEICSGSSAA